MIVLKYDTNTKGYPISNLGVCRPCTMPTVYLKVKASLCQNWADQILIRTRRIIAHLANYFHNNLMKAPGYNPLMVVTFMNTVKNLGAKFD